jgi:Family of unknown function (DUF6494)
VGPCYPDTELSDKYWEIHQRFRYPLCFNPQAARWWHRWTKTSSTFPFEVPKGCRITAQREIEKAVREALNAGRLRGDENLKAKVTLEIEALGLMHLIEGDTELG